MTVFKKVGLFLIPAALFLSSCGSGEVEEESGNDGPGDSTTMEQKLHTQNVFTNIPSPVETATVLLDAGAEYDHTMVNDPLIFKSYTAEEARALNLGVYGADLSFAGIFENSQESMAFLKCVNALCKDLGISGVFDEKTADRLERNKDNRDSILEIVSTSFWDADAYLKENQRPNTSSLIVAGGWVEGMYIACEVYNKTKKEKIKNRIISAPQKSSLTSLVTLLESEKQSAVSQFMLEGLQNLKKIYEKIPEGKPVTTAVTDTVTGETSIETKNNVVVDATLMNEIYTAVRDLRQKMVSTK
ncbi:MAG: hypothetical protein IAF38_19480 [Bacteroidia bacterium]|nr:hypothetical protein [Bacteroidia bacterium]